MFDSPSSPFLPEYIATFNAENNISAATPYTPGGDDSLLRRCCVIAPSSITLFNYFSTAAYLQEAPAPRISQQGYVWNRQQQSDICQMVIRFVKSNVHQGKLLPPLHLRNQYFDVDSISLRRAVEVYSFQRTLTTTVPSIWVEATALLILRARISMAQVLQHNTHRRRNICVEIEAIQEAIYLLFDGHSYHGWFDVYFSLSDVCSLLTQPGVLTRVYIEDYLRQGRESGSF
jgi:hypothetical protein